MMRTALVGFTLAASLGLWSYAAAEESSEADAGPGERSIPLNADDPTIDLWKMTRDLSQDPRKPGPINIQRFPGGSVKSGIPTFFRLPVALTPADLRAGEVDVAIMGAGLDMGTGMRDAAYGPNSLRTAANYVGWGAFADPNMHVMVKWEDQLNVVDYGDAPVDPLSTERSIEPIRAMVREIAETGR